jgi:hypothetical protein
MKLHAQRHQSFHNATNTTWLVNQSDGTWKEEQLTREQLRHLARAFEVKRGRNTDDTVRNLITANRIKFLSIK